MGIRILYIGEIVGKAGVFCIKNGLPKIKDRYGIDFVIANGEGATGGFGIGKNHSIYLHKLGIDVITSGEKAYYKKDMVTHIAKTPYILRPANYPPQNPGRGWRVYQVGDMNVGVIDLLGQSGFSRVHLSNPFTFLPELVSRVKQETPVVIVDFHATTTAEKYSMFYHADGTVTAVIGSHTKVLTSDEQILDGGTGVICDTGRTGSFMSVGGLEPETEIKQLITQIPERSQEYWKDLELQGVVLHVTEDGKTEHIERIRFPVEKNEAQPYNNGSRKNGSHSNGNSERLQHSNER